MAELRRIVLMTEHGESVRYVLFPECGQWVVQGVDLNVGSYGRTPDDAIVKAEINLNVERLVSEQATGVAFGGIPAAPQRFQHLWAGAYV